MKQIKILGVVAIALTLGLTACGKKAECKKHDWGEFEVVQAATCTENGSQKRKCKVCGKEDVQTIKAGHKYGDYSQTVAPSCDHVGKKVRTCSVCGATDEADIPMIDHTWVLGEDGQALIEWTKAPTCTEAGEGGHRHCSVCGNDVAVSDAEAAALGHEFQKDAQGNIVYTWAEGKEPTCTKDGEGTKYCTRCKQNIAASGDEVKALGHDLELVGGEQTAPEGEATVRVYHCKRCLEDYLGFLANEVSAASKTHVAFEPETVTGNQEQGARFLGRPIGNSLALKANGDSQNEQNNECVYCSTETGDFIEYIFTLTEEQAATLQNCRCYVDAQAANYLNGTDFWAYGSGNTDWTPGYYIDGGDERFEQNTDGTFVMTEDHERATTAGQAGAVRKNEAGETVMVKKGKRIEDYRYVLYVDDQVVDFDSSITNPTHGRDQNMQREEFTMPYNFNLHKGQNKIKLVMAGGYRSLFYSFVFRPYEAPEVPEDPWELDEETVMPTPAADEAVVLRYKNTQDASLVKYEIAAKTGNFALDGSSKWKDGYDPATNAKGESKLKGDGDSYSFKFRLPNAFEGKMYQYAYMDGMGSGSSGNHGKKAFYQTNNHANIEVKVNGGTAIDLSQFSATTFDDIFGEERDGSNSVTKNVELGDVVLKTSNTISYKRVETLNMTVKAFVFIGKNHNHSFDYGTDPVPVQKAGECDYVVGQCAADGAKVLKISAAADLNGKITARGGKLPKGTSGKYDGSAIASYKFTAPEGFGSKAHLMAIATPDNAGNYNYSYYTGKDSSGDTKNPMPDGSTNTVVTINTNPITMPKATYKEMGCTGLNEAGAGLVDFGEFDIIEGTNEFTLAATNSYGLQYYDFLIVA